MPYILPSLNIYSDVWEEYNGIPSFHSAHNLWEDKGGHDVILFRLQNFVLPGNSAQGVLKNSPAGTGWSRGASHKAVRRASDRPRSAESAVLMADGLFTSVKCRSVPAFRRFSFLYFLPESVIGLSEAHCISSSCALAVITLLATMNARATISSAEKGLVVTTKLPVDS